MHFSCSSLVIKWRSSRIYYFRFPRRRSMQFGRIITTSASGWKFVRVRNKWRRNLRGMIFEWVLMNIDITVSTYLYRIRLLRKFDFKHDKKCHKVLFWIKNVHSATKKLTLSSSAHTGIILNIGYIFNVNTDNQAKMFVNYHLGIYRLSHDKVLRRIGDLMIRY